MSSSPVAAGEISSTESGIATFWATATTDSVVHGPARQLAPSPTSFSAPEAAVFRVHPAVVVNQLDAVIGAVLVDRGVYLVEREVGGLLARGGRVLELPTVRQQVADRQVERLDAAGGVVTDPHAASPAAAAAAATASASRTSRG